MNRRFSFFILSIFLLLLLPQTVFAQTYVTPTLYCLGSCANNDTPTPTVTLIPSNPVVSSTTAPSVTTTTSTTPQATVNPCASVNDVSVASHRRKHHPKGGRGFFQQFMQLIIQWILKILQLLFGGTIPTPTPGGSTPTPTPGVSVTVSPCISSTPQVSNMPSTPVVSSTGTITQSPTSKPVPTNGAPTPTTPVGGNTTCTNPIGSTSEATGTISIPGTAFQVRNEAWNGSHGPQTIYACSEQSWYVMSNQPNNGGAVETYPDSLYSISGSKTIPQYTSITSTFGEAYQHVGDWNAGYDIWLNNWSKEIMIWNEWNGGPGYWPTQATTAVSLGGVPYHFYNNGGELMFFRDTQVKSGSVDILAAMKWLVTQNLLSSSDVPTQIEYGVEISGTGGANQRFDTTAFTVNIK